MLATLTWGGGLAGWKNHEWGGGLFGVEITPQNALACGSTQPLFGKAHYGFFVNSKGEHLNERPFGEPYLAFRGAESYDNEEEEVTCHVDQVILRNSKEGWEYIINPIGSLLYVFPFGAGVLCYSPHGLMVQSSEVQIFATPYRALYCRADQTAPVGVDITPQASQVEIGEFLQKYSDDPVYVVLGKKGESVDDPFSEVREVNLRLFTDYQVILAVSTPGFDEDPHIVVGTVKVE